MSNKDKTKYEKFKLMKRKEKRYKNCRLFTESDNIHHYSKSKIDKLVSLYFAENISAGMGPQNFLPEDVCC
jgi:hypothetical protein